jgi:hypothetical protein
MQLLRETFWSPQTNFYWVPLMVCARLNLERRNIAEGVAHGVDRQLKEAIINSLFKPEYPPSLIDPEEGELPEDWELANRHWLIFSLLQQRQLQRFSHFGFGPGLAKKDIRSQLGQLRFTDGWAAWRLARQLP